MDRTKRRAPTFGSAYIVFYRATDTQLQIVRILHASRYLDDQALFAD